MQGKLVISPDVMKALREGSAVVALESTIISHGMPYPQVQADSQYEDPWTSIDFASCGQATTPYLRASVSLIPV